MTAKATIRIHVRLDEFGNATACTQQDMDEGSIDLDDTTYIQGATRDFVIEVAASMPEPKGEPEVAATVEVPDQVPAPEGEVTAGVAA
jgi:hypothetical protein